MIEKTPESRAPNQKIKLGPTLFVVICPLDTLERIGLQKKLCKKVEKQKNYSRFFKNSKYEKVAKTAFGYSTKKSSFLAIIIVQFDSGLNNGAFILHYDTIEYTALTLMKFSNLANR